MFNDPTHPAVQTLAEHHDAGTHDQIPADQAADALAAFHQNADPTLVQQVTDQHYQQMAPEDLQKAAAGFQQTLQQAGTPEAQQLAQVDPTQASPEHVSAMHRFAVKEHPELARDVLVGGAVVGVGALAAFAARSYIKSHGH